MTDNRDPNIDKSSKDEQLDESLQPQLVESPQDAQHFIDALRNGDLLEFLRFKDYLQFKYSFNEKTTKEEVEERIRKEFSLANFNVDHLISLAKIDGLVRAKLGTSNDFILLIKDNAINFLARQNLKLDKNILTKKETEKLEAKAKKISIQIYKPQYDDAFEKITPENQILNEENVLFLKQIVDEREAEKQREADAKKLQEQERKRIDQEKINHLLQAGIQPPPETDQPKQSTAKIMQQVAAPPTIPANVTPQFQLTDEDFSEGVGEVDPYIAIIKELAVKAAVNQLSKKDFTSTLDKIIEKNLSDAGFIPASAEYETHYIILKTEYEQIFTNTLHQYRNAQQPIAPVAKPSAAPAPQPSATTAEQPKEESFAISKGLIAGLVIGGLTIATLVAIGFSGGFAAPVVIPAAAATGGAILSALGITASLTTTLAVGAAVISAGATTVASLAGGAIGAVVGWVSKKISDLKKPLAMEEIQSSREIPAASATQAQSTVPAPSEAINIPGSPRDRNISQAESTSGNTPPARSPSSNTSQAGSSSSLFSQRSTPPTMSTPSPNNKESGPRQGSPDSGSDSNPPPPTGSAPKSFK